MYTPWSCLHRNTVYRKLESRVSDRTDVGHQLVSEIRAHRGLYRVQKVSRIADVCIDVTVETVVEESVVDTKVPCQRRLPLDRRIICLRIKHAHVCSPAHVVLMVCVAVDVVSGKVDIIAYTVLLAGKTG